MTPGCRTAVQLPVVSADEAVTWPPPPEEPRIRYVTSFRSALDLGIGGGFLSKLLGKKEQTFLRRPVAVATSGGRKIYVADLAGALILYDLDTGKMRRRENAVKERLISPVALLISEGDSLYVVDSILRKVIIYTSDLKPVRVFASGFERPAGIARDGKTGRIFVSDAGACFVKVFNADGELIATWGRGGEGAKDFNTPTHLWWSADGFLYVTDAFNFRIKKVSGDGKVIGDVGGLGNVPGSFARPKGIATDASGHLYVVDALFGNVQIFDGEGRLLLFFGTSGGMDPGSFCLPNGIFIDTDDRIYVTDTYHGRIQVFQYLNNPGRTP